MKAATPDDGDVDVSVGVVRARESWRACLTPRCRRRRRQELLTSALAFRPIEYYTLQTC